MATESRNLHKGLELTPKGASNSERVIYLRSTAKRAWIVDILIERAAKNRVSLAEECYGILAAYLVKMYSPEDILARRMKYQHKKTKSALRKSKWRF